jgi:hypothetical protein
MRAVRASSLMVAVVVLAACDTPLTPDLFQRQAERVYAEVNPGFGVARRDGAKSVMVRGDQVYILDTKAMFDEYKTSKRSASDWFDEYKTRLDREAKARRRSLDQAKEEVIPILKSGVWIRVQDLGAIGPRSVQDQIRPWRKELAEDVYILLGVPEELLGYRYVSIHELETSQTNADEWLTRAISNLTKKVSTATGSSELRRDDGHLLVLDLPNTDGVSALILDPAFRKQMLKTFAIASVGASVPNRDVLILFDPEEFVAVKPIRARTHALYDERNHPGFRGLLRFDAEKITILEPARPQNAPPQ